MERKRGWPGGALVEVRGLRHVYRAGDVEVEALRGIDLDLGAGERVAIMGHSGSGKTTLLNILAGLETPTAGRSLVGGDDLLKITSSQRQTYRRRVVGYVWQQPEAGLLYELTVLQNVIVPMLGGGSGSALEQIDQTRLAVHILDAMNLGDRLEQRLWELGSSELQRLALAVALANRPLLLLADELTAALSWPAAQAVLGDLGALLDELGSAALLVTHDERVRRYVDRVVQMRDGLVVTEAAVGPAR